MFQFWFEKFISLVVPFFVMGSLIILLFYAFATEAFVEPADQAPFVKEMVEANKKNTKEKNISLNVAHRTDVEIKTYLTKVTSEALTFNKSNFKESIQNIRPYFTKEGLKKYRSYLISSGIVEAVRTQDFQVGAYVETPPLFLNSSVIKETYKWLYEMPMVVSLTRGNIVENADNIDNSEFTLRLQITRVNEDEENPDGLKIEDWNVLAR